MRASRNAKNAGVGNVDQRRHSPPTNRFRRKSLRMPTPDNVRTSPCRSCCRSRLRSPTACGASADRTRSFITVRKASAAVRMDARGEPTIAPADGAGPPGSPPWPTLPSPGGRSCSYNSHRFRNGEGHAQDHEDRRVAFAGSSGTLRLPHLCLGDEVQGGSRRLRRGISNGRAGPARAIRAAVRRRSGRLVGRP